MALCQLLLSPSNVLILDEPTNHLDIQSKQVLKRALLQYEGTFLIVSHDREFLDGLTNRIWDIEDQTLKIHHFGVYEYLQRKLSSDSPTKKTENKAVQKEVVTEPQKNQSQEERKENKRKKNQLQNKVRQHEERVQELEKEVKVLEDQLATMDFTDSAKTAPVLKAFEEMKSKLDYYSDLWMEATELLEIIQD